MPSSATSPPGSCAGDPDSAGAPCASDSKPRPGSPTSVCVEAAHWLGARRMRSVNASGQRLPRLAGCLATLARAEDHIGVVSAHVQRAASFGGARERETSLSPKIRSSASQRESPRCPSCRSSRASRLATRSRTSVPRSTTLSRTDRPGSSRQLLGRVTVPDRDRPERAQGRTLEGDDPTVPISTALEMTPFDLASSSSQSRMGTPGNSGSTRFA